MEWVHAGQFHGKSSTAATKALLEKFGRDRPLKTQEIFEAIQKGGVSIANAEGLYRSLHRDKRFALIGRSLWGLSIWYPDGAKKPKASGAPSGWAVEDDEPDDADDAQEDDAEVS